MLFFCAKENRAVLTNAANTDEAFRQAGKALGIEAREVEDIDLDQFIELPRAPRPGQTVEINMQAD